MHSDEQPQNDLIGSVEAARVLGIHRATFNKRVAAGQIEPAHVGHGRTGVRLFRRDAILGLVRA